MLNFEEELAKFQPVKTMDTLSDSVREELEKKDIAGFLMEIAGQNAGGQDAKPVHRTGQRQGGA